MDRRVVKQLSLLLVTLPVHERVVAQQELERQNFRVRGRLFFAIFFAIFLRPTEQICPDSAGPFIVSILWLCYFEGLL